MEKNSIAPQSLDEKQFELWSESTKPVPYSKRSVGQFALCMIWFGFAVQLVVFMLAGQLYPSVSVKGIVLALILGNTIPAVVIFFTQEIGYKFGVSFPVLIRSVFGIKGAILPAYLRAIPAMFWFGFQTWIGAAALNEILMLVSDYSNLNLCIAVFGALQIFTTFYGITFIKVLNVLSSPLLLVMGIYMTYLMLNGSGVSLGEVINMGGDGTGSIAGATMAFIGGWATLACSIQDIVKDCKVSEADRANWPKTNLKYCASQWLGMVPASVMFGFIGVLSKALTGEWNPVIAISNVVGNVSVGLAIVFQLFILFATWSTNPGANLLNPAYVLCGTFPKHIDFKKGIFLAGVIGLLMFPWKASGALTTVMNILGSILGPVAGMIIADYIIIRKREIALADLYTAKSAYSYWGGVNWAAFITVVVSVLFSLLFPNLMYMASLVCSIVVYALLMKFWVLKKFPIEKCDFSYNDKWLGL